MRSGSRPLLWVAAAVAAALAALLAVRAFQERSSGSLLRPGDATLVARGAQVYRTHCAACHGARLEGQANWRDAGADGLLPAPPHDASGHTWHHPDELLVRITKYGVARAAGLPDHRSAMPAFEGVLSDEEIIAVLSWIKAQWPPELREQHDRINAEYRAARGD